VVGDWSSDVCSSDLLDKGHYADLIAVEGDPLSDVTKLEKVKFVMKGGAIARNDFVK